MKILLRKKILVISIAVTWSLTLGILNVTAQEQEIQFKDVTTGNPHFLAIKYLKDMGLVQGYEDGNFKPDQEINRAEALKMLMGGLKGPQTKNSNPFNFPDVQESDWFYSWVLKAWENYLVNGYPDKMFHPEKTINLAESLKILLLQEGEKIPASVDKAPYSDVAATDWYAPYAAIAKERTLFLESRTNGALNAGQTMDRGDFAELIYRLLRSEKGSRFARATWYADLLAHQETASGEPYEPDHYTVAHKTLPFGTKLLVTNLANGKSVEVTVNDRGPYATGVDLDLSKSAFGAIASTGTGIILTEYQDITNGLPATESPTQQTESLIQETPTQETQTVTQETVQSTQQTQSATQETTQSTQQEDQHGF